MDRLLIRLDEEYGAKVAALMKDEDRSAQKIGMKILREYFKEGEHKAVPSNEIDQVTVPVVEAKTKEDKSVDWVIDHYHQVMPHGVKVSKSSLVGKSLVKRISNLLKTPEFKTSDLWEDYFKLITQSDWLMGRSGDWKASLTWLLGPKNMIKVLGGEYTSHTATAPTMAKTRSEIIDDKNKEAGMTFIERKRAQLQGVVHE